MFGRPFAYGARHMNVHFWPVPACRGRRLSARGSHSKPQASTTSCAQLRSIYIRTVSDAGLESMWPEEYQAH